MNEERVERRKQRKRRQRRRRITACVVLLVMAVVVLAGIGIRQVLYGVSTERETATTIGGIPVITDWIPAQTKGRPGMQRKIKYVVIHETGNKGRNADASSHNNYLHHSTHEKSVSWHYTVDDHEIYHHIPDNEIAFHAGDRLQKEGGNRNGIGVELCINPENDYEKTLDHAATLTAFLLDAYGLDLDAVKKHQDFSGKHCPDQLLSAGRWDEFVEMVAEKQ